MTNAVLDDWRTAPIDERLRATLGFLEKLTLDPDGLTPEDADVARRAGASDAALEDAVHVAAAFNIIDRVADAVGFEVVSRERFFAGARTLLSRGYQ